MQNTSEYETLKNLEDTQGLELAGLAVAYLRYGNSGIEHILDSLEVEDPNTGKPYYNNLSALPLRMLIGPDGQPTDFSLPIAYFNDRWNSTPTDIDEIPYLAQCVYGNMRVPFVKDSTFEPQRLEDYLVFPPKPISDHIFSKMVLKGGLVVPYHTNMPQSAVETVKLGDGNVLIKELWTQKGYKNTTVEEELSKLQMGEKVVVDTWHIREENPDFKTTQSISLPNGSTVVRFNSAVEQAIGELVVNHMGLLHFQASRRDKTELKNTLMGENTELARLIQIVNDAGYFGPVVVEHMFNLKDQLFNLPGVIEEAKRISAWLRENL